MPEATILFVCPDNSLLGPLAEAYMNTRGRGLVRAFSAGTKPAQMLHPAVSKLLSAHEVPIEGLQPKSMDIFLMPHAPFPDQVIYLADMPPVNLPTGWDKAVSVENWQVAGPSPFPSSFSYAAEYFRRIRLAADRVLLGEPLVGPTSRAEVA
ncbi:arsenate-mycothiol transferase ArsC [Roseibium suaedae]|uniref:Protein-tyrosine-phosphatase n=1 Tax=Roseibium suaedae TaxID=735517 RepID=A0A1M6Z9G5_9HYPH|nr:hypothetical protein [Roseibium suaedae]SHL27041.1 Protein-tyrosine-phosphatase [Roseibium suaedae]